VCQRFNAAEDSGGVGRGCCLAQVGVSAISLLMMQRVWAGGADRTGGCVAVRTEPSVYMHNTY